MFCENNRMIPGKIKFEYMTNILELKLLMF